MIKITSPLPADYPGYYGTYIRKVKGDDLIKSLTEIHQQTKDVLKNVSEEKLNYRYAPGKWTIKEIIGHLADGERVFAYRALCFARNDKTPLPAFEENDWAIASNAGQRTFSELMDEFDAVRESTLRLFKSFDEEMILRKGIANEVEISVKAIGYSIAGHELHHAEVIKERYL
ncbi:MAG TPA: DinB family protein [Bacteroidia bacterium]|nr:DinB family protein [Bacteroidia bacterium]